MFEIRSRKTVYLTHDGQTFRVYPIRHFSNTVLVEPETGVFFHRFRKTPKTRDKGIKRGFRKYPDVYSLFRGLWQAIQSTKLSRIPTLEELQADCRDINFEVNSIKVINETEIEKARQALANVLKQLEHVQTVELREAKEQTSFAILFRDSRNRLNTGMVCARLVAVRNRITERIDNIIRWLRYYTQWADAISIFLTFHRRFLPRLDSRLERLIAEIPDPVKNRFTIGRILSMKEEIGRRQFFGGWCEWAKQCQKDLITAIKCVRQRKTTEAIAVLKKVRQAIKLKLIQYQIHELLLEIDLDQISQKPRLDHYRQVVKEIIKELEAVDESGFRVPVKEEVATLLSLAVSEPNIKDFPTFFKAGKELLRRAYQKL
jgi:hypothetical protein